MKWWEILIHIVGIAFCMYAYIKCYSIIFKSKIEINLKSITMFAFVVVVSFYNTFYNYDISKIFISFFGLFFLFKIIFKDNFKSTFLKAILLYMLGWIAEMILGIALAYFFIDAIQQFDSNLFFKFLFSVLMNLVMLLCANLKFIKIIYNKLYNLMQKVFNMMILMIITIVVIVILTYYLIISTDIYSIGAILILIAILFTIIVIAMIQSVKTKKANDKQEILLDFMKEYEMVIDKERIDRHEMVNNLLVLKSFKNKNTKEFDKILDGMLLTYQSNKTPKGLYELPSGLKGLFYYKIYDMRNKNIEVFINISNKIINDLDSLDSKMLTRVCKILGILLDNAKEAASESKNKLVIIDLYKEGSDITIYIENSVKNDNIDLNNLKLKGFSTKGTNRGYGLYLVDKLLGKTNNISLKQEIKDNKFMSILTIKNN